MSEPKYPNVVVELVGEDGNAFAILGRVRRALREAGVGKAEVDAFTAEATSGNYDHLLQTVMRWVAVDEPETDEDEEDMEYQEAHRDDPEMSPWARDAAEGDR